MRRIIGADVFDGKPIEGEYTLTVYDLGNGHREAVVQQAVGWEHAHTLTADEMDYLETRYGERDRAEKEKANKARAARRAKTRCRRLVKAMGLDALLTLTYRANQGDLADCKAHFAAFVRRVRAVIPGFAYVAAFEQQKRGAWHVHLAIHALPLAIVRAGVKVKSYTVVRAIWRSVVGELGGNIDQQRRKRNSKQTSSKLAAYLSKYMLKAFEDGDDWSNRYSASRHSIPDGAKAVFRGTSLREMIELAYSFAADGRCMVSSYLARWGDVFYVSSELGEGPPVE